MAMLTVNGAAVPAPSGMAVTVFDVSGGAVRSASGSAVMDRSAVKCRLELHWAHIPGEELAQLLGAIGGFFDVEYPDPQLGRRTMCCYCSDRVAGVLRMQAGSPVWTDGKMSWTER